MKALIIHFLNKTSDCIYAYYPYQVSSSYNVGNFLSTDLKKEFFRKLFFLPQSEGENNFQQTIFCHHEGMEIQTCDTDCILSYLRKVLGRQKLSSKNKPEPLNRNSSSPSFEIVHSEFQTSTFQVLSEVVGELTNLEG